MDQPISLWKAVTGTGLLCIGIAMFNGAIGVLVTSLAMIVLMAYLIWRILFRGDVWVLGDDFNSTPIQMGYGSAFGMFLGILLILSIVVLGYVMPLMSHNNASQKCLTKTPHRDAQKKTSQKRCLAEVPRRNARQTRRPAHK